MKVRELIDLLEQQEADADIWIATQGNDGEILSIYPSDDREIVWIDVDV